MSFKFFFVIFVLSGAVVISSVVIGTLVLQEITPVYSPSERLLVDLLVWNDGSWELKIRNDFSKDLLLEEYFISVSDIYVNDSSKQVISQRERAILKSGPDNRVTGGVPGFNYFAFVRVVYSIDNSLFSDTRKINGFYKQL